MEETLLALAPAILVVAVAVFLRMRRSIKAASDETTSLQKKVTTLEKRIRELEREQSQAKERAYVRLPQAAAMRPMMRPATAPPIHSLPLTEVQKEVAEVLNQLHVMKAQLPLDSIVEEKYITELNAIVDRLESATG